MIGCIPQLEKNMTCHSNWQWIVVIRYSINMMFRKKIYWIEVIRCAHNIFKKRTRQLLKFLLLTYIWYSNFVLILSAMAVTLPCEVSSIFVNKVRDLSHLCDLLSWFSINYRARWYQLTTQITIHICFDFEWGVMFDLIDTTVNLQRRLDIYVVEALQINEWNGHYVKKKIVRSWNFGNVT